MLVLKEHLKAVSGCLALFIAMVFLQAAAYRFSLELGNLMYLVGAVALTMSAILFGLRMEGFAFSGMVSMCLSFGLVGVFTSASWYTRRMLFDIDTPFDQSDIRNDVILYVIVPLVVAAIITPPAIKLLRQKTAFQDAV